MEIKNFNKFQMTDYERGLMFKVVDGFEPNFVLLYDLKKNYFACERILEYLIKNKITGERLFKWIKFELNNSPLKAWKFCLEHIHSDRNHKVIYGRDYKCNNSF
jgi:hypothetical protein